MFYDGNNEFLKTLCSSATWFQTPKTISYESLFLGGKLHSQLLRLGNPTSAPKTNSFLKERCENFRETLPLSPKFLTVWTEIPP
jgi:hypothetical protein